MNKTYVIQVVGGVAFKADDYEDVVIIDFDNYKDFEDMGSEENGYDCPHCKAWNSEFEWNTATMHSTGADSADNIRRFQRAADGHDAPQDLHYTCAYCYKDSNYLDITGQE